MWTPNSKLEDGQFILWIYKPFEKYEPSDIHTLESHRSEDVAQAERKDRTSEQSGKHDCKMNVFVKTK